LQLIELAGVERRCRPREKRNSTLEVVTMMGEMKLSRDWLCEVKADLHGARQICGWTCIEKRA
jgi:hypothetical protein